MRRHSPSPQNDAVRLQRLLQNRNSPKTSGSSYAPSSHTTMQMKKQCFSWTAMRTVPRRHQPRLGAEAGASQHTTRYFLVGRVHSALHRGGEAITPCPAHAQKRRILLSTWPPIQHRCGGSLGSVKPHSTNASHFSDVLGTCVAQSDWRLCRRPCMKGGDIDPASERCCY
ncbi:hypothetical protein TcCL_Unassigned04046 [Trypanosoma cruzi]|nr:hypothetical protein TcCL_Unassigned04046 [Trypanosoma cruzi]